MRYYLRYSLILALMVAWGAVGCAPSPQELARIQQEAVGRGQELYLSNGCAVCHGREGRGDGLTAKQYYPPPTNFHDPKAYRQGTSRGAIMRTIQNGVPREGSAMAAFKHLTAQELRDLAIYLESLQQSENVSPIKEEDS